MSQPARPAVQVVVYVQADDECMFLQELPLHPPVDETPARLQFVKKKALLKVHTMFSLPASDVRFKLYQADIATTPKQQVFVFRLN